MGAQYAARFGLPSKIVFISGSPNARVLWALQNVAATISPGVKFSGFNRNMENSVANKLECSRGKIIRRVMPCLSSKPSPVVNALQNAFQTIPSKMILFQN